MVVYRRPLKDSSAIPKYFFLCNLVGYLKGLTASPILHCPLNGQASLFRQSQVNVFVDGFFPRLFLL